MPKKLALDFRRGSTLSVVMTLSEEDRADLPRRLFALAGRRLESAGRHAAEGEGRAVAPERMAHLSGHLHEAGEDLKVIADAIAALAGAGSRP